jgi:hypothetical protein
VKSERSGKGWARAIFYYILLCELNGFFCVYDQQIPWMILPTKVADWFLIHRHR